MAANVVDSVRVFLAEGRALALGPPKAGRWLVPIIILTLPLEISKRLFPFLHADAARVGIPEQVSILDLGRIAILLAMAFWALKAASERSQPLRATPLNLALAVLFGLFALSLAYTADFSSGVRETLRLGFHIGLFLIIPALVADALSLRWCLWALMLTGLGLGAAAIYQEAAGVFFWNPTLELASVPRVNATFLDPNQFARFLDVVLVLAAARFFFAGVRERLFLLATLGVGLTALLFTSSRSAWLTLPIVLVLLVVLLPLSVRRKGVLLAAGSAAVLAVVLSSLAIGGPLADRLETLSLGRGALEEREYLIQGGWQMFLDHPLVGVGVGGFQKSLRGPYSDFIWPGYEETYSHTSVITILAELGLVGLLATAFLAYRWGVMGWLVYRRADREGKAMALGLLVATAVIFLTSQGEGRFYEDPYLWLLFGLMAAMYAILPRGRLPQREAAS